MTEPLLSICIPTYNRAKFLGEVFASILPQKADPALFEIRVRDNASSDDSEAVFRAAAGDRPNWHWFRNEKNLGGRANVRLCTEQAKGRFVWIVGSDDPLMPDALELLLGILPRCAAANAAALLMHPALPASYAGGVPIDPPFSWLRHVSINIPAFVSSVVWEREFWSRYPYEAYSMELSLPQLDCFIDACMTRPVFGLNRAAVEAGSAEDTSKPGFWFYTRHATVDAFEYPTLYQKVLSSPRVDLHSRVMIWLRRTANLRHVRHKLIFMRYNQQYYHTRARDLRRAHHDTLAWPFIFLYAKAILEWDMGGRIAQRRHGNVPKVPARERPDEAF